MDDIIQQSEDKDDIINVEEREIPDEDEVFSERIPQKIAPVNSETTEEDTSSIHRIP